MTREEASKWLELAVPVKAVTQEEFNTFIEAVNMAIKALEAQADGKWISISERLPEEGGRYLVYTWSHEIETAQYVDGYWNIKTPISAWMPLPEPYEGATEDDTLIQDGVVPADWELELRHLI